MKTVKQTLIVLGTIIGVILVLYFGSAIIAAIYEVNQRRKAQDQLFKDEDAKITVEEKIDTFITANKGKKIELDTCCYEDFIPLYNDLSIYGGINQKLKSGVKITLTGKPFTEHRIEVRKGRKLGYINYWFIPALKKLRKIDPVFKNDE